MSHVALEDLSVAMILTSKQRNLIGRYRDLLVESNRQFNLTAPGTPQEIEQRLVTESVLLAPAFRDNTRKGSKVADIGTGAGVPGIPLAIALPDRSFTLIDATSKKIRFVEHVVHSLGLTNVTSIHGRAEDLAHQPAFREVFDVATARAVGSLATLLELALPLLHQHGRAIFVKGDSITDELDQAKSAAKLLGAIVVSVTRLDEPASVRVTQLVIADKIEPIASQFPRRAGIPAKHPLGGRADERPNLLS